MPCKKIVRIGVTPEFKRLFKSTAARLGKPSMLELSRELAEKEELIILPQKEDKKYNEIKKKKGFGFF